MVEPTAHTQDGSLRELRPPQVLEGLGAPKGLNEQATVAAPGPSTPTFAEQHAKSPSLGQALLHAFGNPMFRDTLAKLIAKGGGDGIRRLWSAVGEILQTDSPKRVNLAHVIRTAINQHYHTNVRAERVAPTADTVAQFLISTPDRCCELLEFFTKKFGVSAPAVMTVRGAIDHAPTGSLFAYLQRNYESLVGDAQNYQGLSLMYRAIASRSDPESLSACAFIRNRYDAVRASAGRYNTGEARFLRNLRDDITAQLLESPRACERNLKLALLFSRSVPHPCLDWECKKMSRDEEWILGEGALLQSVFGFEGTDRMRLAHDKGGLTSASFVLPDGVSDVACCGVRAVHSRYEERASVLIPLYRHVGLCPETGQQLPLSSQSLPRSGMSIADEARFRESCTRTMLTSLSYRYWDSDVAATERDRNGARELLRDMAREYPYIMAEAVRSCSGLSHIFRVELQRIAREGMRDAFNQPDATQRDKLMCEAVALVSSVGLGRAEFSPVVLDGFERALAGVKEQEPGSSSLRAHTAAATWLSRVTPSVERRSAEIMLQYPDTIEASRLAGYLFQVRCSDPAIKEFVCAQALRPDLNPPTWLNYARAALGFGLEPEQRKTLRDVFALTYKDPLEVWAERDSGVRTSYRLFTGGAFPERVGGMTPLATRESGLTYSLLEQRVFSALSAISGVRVSQGIFIPWAPAIDGALYPEGVQGKPIAVLVDGERYHSVNGVWLERGFDGHSLFVNRILTQAGYPVLRVSQELGEPGRESDLREAVGAALQALSDGQPPTSALLVVNPPDDFREIAGKVILYKSA